jgi:hypothetical protein
MFFFKKKNRTEMVATKFHRIQLVAESHTLEFTFDQTVTTVSRNYSLTRSLKFHATRQGTAINIHDALVLVNQDEQLTVSLCYFILVVDLWGR